MTNLPTGLGEFKDPDLIAEMVSRGYVVNADVQIEHPLTHDDSELDKILQTPTRYIHQYGCACTRLKRPKQCDCEPFDTLDEAKQAILTLMERRAQVVEMTVEDEKDLYWSRRSEYEARERERLARIDELKKMNKKWLYGKWVDYFNERITALTQQSPTNKGEE